MDTNVRIKEIMSSMLITKPPESNIVEIARVMAENQIGSVIITENGNNEGIVTERDICYKVVAKNKDPSTVKAKEVMTSNLVSISSDKTLTDAAKLMVKKGIRRLAVSEKGKISGILTVSDIIAVSPGTIEILRELYDIYSATPGDGGAEESVEPLEGGTCEVCGTFTDKLIKINSRYLCEDCKEDEA